MPAKSRCIKCKDDIYIAGNSCCHIALNFCFLGLFCALVCFLFVRVFSVFYVCCFGVFLCFFSVFGLRSVIFGCVQRSDFVNRHCLCTVYCDELVIIASDKRPRNGGIIDCVASFLVVERCIQRVFLTLLKVLIRDLIHNKCLTCCLRLFQVREQVGCVRSNLWNIHCLCIVCDICMDEDCLAITRAGFECYKLLSFKRNSAELKCQLNAATYVCVEVFTDGGCIKLSRRRDFITLIILCCHCVAVFICCHKLSGDFILCCAMEILERHRIDDFHVLLSINFMP